MARSDLAPAQRFVLSIGAILTTMNGERVDLLGGAVRPTNAGASMRVLADQWGLTTTEELVARIERLTTSQGGPRLGFELGRAVSLADLGYSAYLLDAETAWAAMTRAALRVQASFEGFGAFAASYALGRRQLLGEEAAPEEGDGPTCAAAIETLLHDAASPWVQVPFDVTLDGVAAPRLPRRTLSVGRGGCASIAEALALAEDGDRIEVAAGTYRERVRVSTADWDEGDEVARPPRAPSVELVAMGKVVLTAREGPVVEVDDGGVVLQGFTIVNERARKAKEDQADAVVVVDGFARLVHCTLRAANGAGFADHEASQLVDCTVEGCDVGVRTTGCMLVRGGVLRGSTASNVVAEDQGTITLVEATVEAAGHSGIYATDRAVVVAARCKVRESVRVGLLATERASLRATDCLITESGIAALYADEKAGVEVLRCTLQKCDGSLVQLLGTGPAELSECQILGRGTHGIVFGGDTRAIVVDSTISGTLHAAVVAQREAKPTLRRCTLRAGKQGSGLFVSDRADATLEACTISGSAFAAVELSDAARASFADCTLLGARADGLTVSSKGDARLTDCVVEGGGQAGVRVREGAYVLLERCRVHGQREAAIAALTRGRARIVDCDVGPSRLSLVEVRGKSEVVVRGGVFHDGEAAGVYAYEGGRIDLEDCELVGNDVNVRLHGGGGRIVGCALRGAKTAGIYCADGARPTLDACTITANGAAGVEVSDDARPHVRRSHVFANENDLHVYDGGRALFEDGALGGAREYAIRAEDGGVVTVRRTAIGAGQLGDVHDPAGRVTREACTTGDDAFEVCWTRGSAFAPCTLVDLPDGRYSLIVGGGQPVAFDALERALRARRLEPDGHGFERLLRALVARDAAPLAGALTFDPEAGMLVVTSAEREALARVAALFRAAVLDPAPACALLG